MLRYLAGVVLTCLLLLSVAGVPGAAVTERRIIAPRGVHLLLVPEKNRFSLLNQYREVTDFLAAKLGVSVFLDVVSSYEQALRLLTGRRADGAFLGSLGYLQARQRFAAEPIARPVWVAGGEHCRSYIIVRRSAAIDHFQQLKGRRFALIDTGSATGYFFPVFYAGNNGVPVFADYFSGTPLVGSHDTAVWAVALGEVDAAAVKDHVYAEMLTAFPYLADQLQILARSSPLPGSTLVLREDLPAYLRERVCFLLLQMDKVREGKEALARFGAQKFVAAENADYDGLRAMLAESGLASLAGGQ